MAQSFTSIYIHLVFSTKDRYPFLDNSKHRSKVFAYMAGFLKAHKSTALIVNGQKDHVHILLRLSPTQSISDLVRDLKRATTKKIRENGNISSMFAWQDGYSAFSVSVNLVDNVRSYIENQEQHHRKKTFEEEYIEFLNKQGITYDERYVLG